MSQTITHTNKETSELLNVLLGAESFISGFEDDDSQEGIAELLASLRNAIAVTMKGAA